MIANGSTLTSDFIPESKIIAKQYLYDELKPDSMLLSSDTVFQNFVSANETEAIGYLHDTKMNLKDAAGFDPVFAQTISYYNSLIKIQADSINYIDSLFASNQTTNYSLLRQQKIDSINVYQLIIEDSLNSRKSISAAKISNAESKNNLVLANDLPNDNQKVINQKEILLRRSGIDTLMQAYSEILSIAQECPYAGGSAVYRARAIIEMMNIEMDYDDDAVCSEIGIYRQSKNEDETPQILIIPNPANDKIEIILKGKYEGLCCITVSDALGKSQIEKTFNCIDKSYILNVKRLSPAAYFVHVKVNDNSEAYGKIIIVR
ncbi:MAG: T9SS type A sorting domain-containing protein [Bacteroidota bacterium]